MLQVTRPRRLDNVSYTTNAIEEQKNPENTTELNFLTAVTSSEALYWDLKGLRLLCTVNYEKASRPTSYWTWTAGSNVEPPTEADFPTSTGFTVRRGATNTETRCLLFSTRMSPNAGTTW